MSALDERGHLPSHDVRADLALRSARLGTYVYDPQAHRADGDANLLELFGFEPGQRGAALESLHGLVHPSDAPALRAVFERAVQDGRPFEHEYRIYRRDDELRWMHAYGNVVEHEGSRVIVGVVQDVTERRLAELESDAARSAEQLARQAASTSQRRLELLARVSTLIDTPLDLEAVLQRVAELAIGELADWCIVELETAEGRPHQVAVAHRDPAMVALARELQDRYPTPADDPSRAHVIGDLAPLHLREITDDLLRESARDVEHLHILRSLGMSSAIAVPLQTDGRAFGVLTLVATHGRQLSAEDVELAGELGRRAGAAVGKARLHAEREQVSRDLAVSEARYRTLVESGSLDVWRADPSGAVTTDMAAWRQLTGSKSTLDWEWLDDVHPDDQDRVRDTWLASIASGTRYDCTYRLRAASGWRWVEARGAAVHADPSRPDSEILEWIGSVVDVTGEVTSRTRTEALRDCAEALARALDVEQVLTSMQVVAAESLTASGSVVALVEDRTLEIYQRGYDGLQLQWTESLTEAKSAWPGIRSVLETGVPRFISSLDEMADLPGTDAAAFAQVQAAISAGEVSWAYLPLRYGAELLGVVRFGWIEAQSFDLADQATLVAIAAQHSAALTRARLYDAERTTSLTLQRALTPEVPRHVNGVSIGLHYRAAGIGAQVGGDWADAFTLADGRVCLVVGDVMGSGITAAATMGRLRTALATLALHESDPGQLLHDLDRMLVETPGDPIATVALAVVDSATSSVDLYSAGHLPALIAPWVGQVRLVPAHQVPPVGVGWSGQGLRPQPTRVETAPGAVIALCSDGLVETRTDSIDNRLALWTTVVQEHLPLGNLDEEAPVLVEAMHAAHDDDVTLLLARLP
jgi:PAS domain S-box-containing protein